MWPPSPSSAVNVEVNKGYVVEVWSWYTIGMIIIALRHGVRLRTVGFGGYQGDDYLSFLAIILYTVDSTLGYLAYYAGGNISVKPDQVDSLSDEDVRVLEWGSKMEFVTWYTYPAFVWVMKFSILFFYQRLGVGLIKESTIKLLFIFCGVTWAALVASVSLTCLPFHNNWTVWPLPGERCIFRAQNFYALAVLNIVTDVCILTIPAPMLWHLRVSIWKRIGVTCLLCGGLFVISAAIIRCALTLTAAPSVLTINIWGYRETVIALVAVTAPVLSPLFRKGFWRRGGWVRRPSTDPQRRVAEAELRDIERRRRFSPGWDFGSSIMKSSFATVKSSMRSAIATTTTRTAHHGDSDLEASAGADGGGDARGGWGGRRRHRAPQMKSTGTQTMGAADFQTIQPGTKGSGMEFITGSSLLAVSEDENLSRPETGNNEKGNKDREDGERQDSRSRPEASSKETKGKSLPSENDKNDDDDDDKLSRYETTKEKEDIKSIRSENVQNEKSEQGPSQ
ncbi:hypothetical protein MGG_01420 [Pyricularia oryzae 70-15]|uniref:Rhodopsin domain-containing protein n=1 Tax=Pyricularia oryzae (strain 70-15 / ATCC MYA-4617 / FGSC 8958) TaxID=242507 RepID=G4MZK2_PYRO7|nr:uncharacterized protein MGG_01420 [Pyricularia oryzae 70-15]EHA54561.1 hypothetical protein MGG_01420 [Pyricularia oryzae 70-15]